MMDRDRQKDRYYLPKQTLNTGRIAPRGGKWQRVAGWIRNNAWRCDRECAARGEM